MVNSFQLKASIKLLSLVALSLSLVGCSDSRNSQFLTEELLHAITNNDFRAVEELIKSGADVNASFEGLDGWTPLIQSAYQGKTEIVKVLVSAGADVDLADSTGGTALMSACITGKSQTVKFLIFAGCDVNLTICVPAGGSLPWPRAVQWRPPS